MISLEFGIWSLEFTGRGDTVQTEKLASINANWQESTNNIQQTKIFATILLKTAK
jgi:hypothetical protein